MLVLIDSKIFSYTLSMEILVPTQKVIRHFKYMLLPSLH